MWNPRRFLRNLFAFGFLAILLFTLLNNTLGGFAAVMALFFAPAAAASLSEGLKYAEATRRKPAPTAIWMSSRNMAEVYLAFLAIVSLLLALGSQDFRIWLAHSNLLGIAVVYGTITLIALAVIRWSYAGGVSLALRDRNNNTG